MAPDTLQPVPQKLGDYDLLTKIAEGSAGMVYKGRHRQSGDVVALKIVSPRLAANAVFLKRFEQEFRAASMLDHPSIVRALEYHGQENPPFLVMEFVEGEALGQKLERDGRMSEQEAVCLIVQVCQGLHLAHKKGLIHRDVKPDNILVTPDGQAKLCDLGLVKETETELDLTRTGRGLGTPHFMAPEQFRNAKSVDIRCDIYSLGATLYMMVTGELPFKAKGPLEAWMQKIKNDLKAPRQLVPTLSERLDWAIRRAMSADPTLRPVSCREFVTDLIGRCTHKTVTPDLSETEIDLWFVEFLDEQGKQRTAMGTTQDLKRSLLDGVLGDVSRVRAGRTKSGPYQLLATLPQFSDLRKEVDQPVRLKRELPSADRGAPEKGRLSGRTPVSQRLPNHERLTQSGVPPLPTGEPGHRPYLQFIDSRQGSTDSRPTRKSLHWLKWIVLLGFALVPAVLAGKYLFPLK
jgi:serine/threonine protein kinase